MLVKQETTHFSNPQLPAAPAWVEVQANGAHWHDSSHYFRPPPSPGAAERVLLDRPACRVLKETVHPPSMWFYHSSFVVLAIRKPNQRDSRSYEPYRRRYSTSKILIMGLSNFRYLIQRLIHGLTQQTTTCGRGENVVPICERLQTKI